ncbi:uncharacterized protein PHACADRAFT_175233 [Phanerochaete carnosa HHB-10118-sp]|uniref:Uncharacterized protein n=1 Tax=Phanerochaete carnosa (strain HHB-10118-sp) TaxID=650164 RepID=K5UXA0_PHACS|nr:uncharacterized protein PHACADRAFT_175233 [Phanerochaete carnosa HHB-10118-sp]EKM54721.1 hypothetical protein PHACADRAFT_175233 [Phanerochaete carnosa HHB-10118-sp]
MDLHTRRKTLPSQRGGPAGPLRSHLLHAHSHGPLGICCTKSRRKWTSSQNHIGAPPSTGL